jgi:hypothetical protein
MGLVGALLLLAGGGIAIVNAWTTRWLWATPIFETPQKVAQTVLIWLIPGSAFLVLNVLREPRIGGRPDPTAAGGTFDAADWLLLGQSGESGHHGNDGGGHHGGYGGDGGHH